MHPPWSASFFPDSEEMRAAGSGSLPWELEERHIVWMVTVFQFVYWVVTIVILMNLLIAMMASTYQKVSDNAEAEYQMQFAKIVKENYETTVLPVPLNMFEHLANHLASRCQKRQELGKISLRWGKRRRASSANRRSSPFNSAYLIVLNA